jgi:hypothetical protein
MEIHVFAIVTDAENLIDPLGARWDELVANLGHDRRILRGSSFLAGLGHVGQRIKTTGCAYHSTSSFAPAHQTPSPLPSCTLTLVQWLAVSPRYHPQELIGNLVLLFKMLINEFQLITVRKNSWKRENHRVASFRG